MDRDELVFVLRAIAEDVEKGFKQAEQAADSLGESYEGLTEAEKRMHEANDDLKKRLEALKTGMKGVNVESAKMPKEIRQVSSAFRAAASGAGAFAVAMIGIQLVVGIINKIKDAAEKAKKELEELNKEANKLAQQTGGMAFLVNRYEELAKQVTRSKEETAQMEGISRTLVDTYGMRADAVDDEGRLILTSLGYMKEQLEVSRELTILIGQRAEAENKKSTADALKLLNEGEERRLEIIEKIAALEADLSADFAYSDWVEATGELEDLSQRIVDAYELVGERAQLAMQVARTQMGDEAAKIPAEVQARIMEEVLKSGEMPTAALFVEKFTKALKDGIKPAEGAGEAIKLTTEQIERMAAKAKAAKTDLKGMTSSVQGLDNSTASLKKEIQDLNDLQTAINVLKEGDQSSKDFGLALDYLAERYGVSADQVLENLDVYQRDADIKATLLELNLLLAEQEAITAKQTAVAMAQAGDITVYQASRMIAALDDVILKLRELSGSDGVSGLASVGVSVPRWRSAPKVSTARATAPKATKVEAYKNTALEKELALIERKRNLDQITTAEEIQLLEKALAAHAKTAKEREQIEDQIYAKKKSLRQQDLEHLRAMGELTIAEEIAFLEKEASLYREGTEAKLAAEEALYTLRQYQRSTEFEHKKAMGELTIAEEIAFLEKEASLYREGTEAKLAAEEALYTLRQYQRSTEFEHKKAMGELTIAEEIAFLEKEASLYREGTEAKLAAEEALYTLRQYQRSTEFEHKKAMGELTIAEEIAFLEKEASLYREGTEAKLAAEEALYTLRQYQRSTEFEHKKAMDQLTIQDEIAYWEQVVQVTKSGTTERMAAEQQVHQLRMQMARQILDDDIYYARISLEQKREYIKQVLAMLQVGTAAWNEWHRMLYDTELEIRQRDTDALQKLSDGVITALRNKYNAHKESEIAAINASSSAWSSWADGQIEAINAQIRALDDLTKAETREDEEARRKRRIAALEQQRQYETDEYNQRKLDEQITKETDELNKWLLRNEREDQKQSLRDEADRIRQQQAAQQASFQAQIASVNSFYAERLEVQNLAAEAEKLLMEGTQEEIIELLGEFAPEYDAIGKTLGEKLYEGFVEKARDIVTFIDGINQAVAGMQANAATLATDAAAEFWATQSGTTTTGATGTSVPGQPVQSVTINIYEGIDSPADLAREMERTLDRMSRT